MMNITNNPLFSKAIKLLKLDLSKLYEINNNTKYILRISKTPWHLPIHFDCSDRKLLQLFNKRDILTMDYDINKNYDINKQIIPDIEKNI